MRSQESNMSGVGTLPIPKEELERIATANRDLVDVAKELRGLMNQVQDQAVQAALRAQVEKILLTSNTVSNAVRTAAYLARQPA
jgi:hypothetical protein